MVNNEGDYIVEFSPFLDDEGKPVILEEKKKEPENVQQPTTPAKTDSAPAETVKPTETKAETQP